MIDDELGNAPSAGTSESQTAAAMPELKADPADAPDTVAELPRDIAREPPRDIAREALRPIRDIARDAGTTTKEPFREPRGDRTRDREAAKESTRDASRDPLQDFLRDFNASREAPRQAPNQLAASAAGTAAPAVVTVRSRGVTLMAILILLLGIIGGGLLAWQLNLLQNQMNDLRAAMAQNGKVGDAVSRLADSATQANEIAGQALAAATRPWVGVDAVEAGAIQAGQPLNIEVRVRNSGRTPTTDVQGLFLVYISPLNNPPALLADQCASCVRSVLLPNGVASYKLSVRENVMTADEVQRIKDGKDTMWIVGRLDYHDAEGEAHATRACLYYRTGGIASFTACSDGNSAN